MTTVEFRILLAAKRPQESTGGKETPEAHCPLGEPKRELADERPKESIGQREPIDFRKSLGIHCLARDFALKPDCRETSGVHWRQRKLRSPLEAERTQESTAHRRNLTDHWLMTILRSPLVSESV